MMSVEIIICIVAVAAMAYYYRVAALTPRYHERIRDIITIGFIIWVTPYIACLLNMGAEQFFCLAGGLIFAYGWAILIKEKIYQGYRSED